MKLYDRLVLPRLVHLTCDLKPNRLQRRKVVPLARGDVLEIGFGSGLNLPFYDAAAVTKLWALEPSEEMLGLAATAIAAAPLSIELLAAGAEQIPLPDRSVDAVLVTYSLCTIPDVALALTESRRVLRAGGQLVFCEHGEAPDQNVLRWQNRLNPLWRRMTGGCNLNRPIPSLLQAAGFRIANLSTMYIPGWKPACYNYWGTAVVA